MPITISTELPYGNVCAIAIKNDPGSVEVEFAADPHRGPECLWFCFRIAKISPEPCQQLILTLKHVSNMLGGTKPDKIVPVIKYDNADWIRLGSPKINLHPDNQSTISWIISMPDKFVDIAYCYPYGLPEIDALIQDTKGYWHADTIGVSQNARPLVRLSNHYGSEKNKTPGVYLIARQHSGETSGSWVLDGLLRALATFGEKAPLVWVVPLSNIDGITNGDYGKDNFPYDLNRAWGNPSMRHEILVIMRDIRRWKTLCKPVTGLDFHSPGACETEGIYCFIPKHRRLYSHLKSASLAKRFQKALGLRFASKKFAKIARYKSRWSTPTFADYLWREIHKPSLSFETPYAMIGNRLLSRADYQEAGALIAQALMKLCKD